MEWRLRANGRAIRLPWPLDRFIPEVDGPLVGTLQFNILVLELVNKLTGDANFANVLVGTFIFLGM